MLPGMTGNGFFGTADVAKNYWRLRFPSGSPHATDLGISEVEMHLTVGSADLATSGNASASSAASGAPASEAFDDVLSNTSAWFCSPGSQVGSWLSNNLGSSQDLQEIIVTGSGVSSDYGPTEIVIDYSPDGSTWTNDTRWPTLTSLRWTVGNPAGEVKKIRRTDTGLPVINVAGRPLFNADDTGWTGYTVRSPIAVASVPGESGNRIRFAIQPASSTGLTISAAYIGILSGTYGGTLQQVTFNGGSSGFTASAGGSAQWSDDITLTTTSTDGLIISLQVSGGGGFRAGGASNGVYYKNATDASNNSPTGYLGWNADFIAGLERWNA